MSYMSFHITSRRASRINFFLRRIALARLFASRLFLRPVISSQVKSSQVKSSHVTSCHVRFLASLATVVHQSRRQE